jgi:hypothetical protein
MYSVRIGYIVRYETRVGSCADPLRPAIMPGELSLIGQFKERQQVLVLFVFGICHVLRR